MTSSQTLRHPQASHTDPEDGEPIWSLSPGERVLPDAVAWERLGVGMRCETWLAWSPSTWAPVVLKLARPGQLAGSRVRESLWREATALAACRHPDLPDLVADGHAEAIPHLLISYVDGPDLDQVLDGGPLPPIDVMVLAWRLLAVLRSMHAAGYAHLDLTPANVVLRDGHPVLVDLGSARPLGRPQPAGRPIGTAGYTAPELEAAAPISASMDVFGVGVVLAEAALGRALFDQDVAPPDRAEVGGLLSGVHQDVAELVTLLLEPDPRRRIHCAGALAHIGRLSVRDDWEHLTWPRWVSRELEAELEWVGRVGR